MIVEEADGWYENGYLYSWKDLEKAKEFAPGLLVPDQPIQTMLLLGVCQNNDGALTLEKYPDVQITYVDHRPTNDQTINQDALDFLQTTDQTFDYVVVDIYEDGPPSPLIYTEEFYQALARVSPLVKVNALETDSLDDFPFSAYFKLVRSDFNNGNRILVLERI